MLKQIKLQLAKFTNFIAKIVFRKISKSLDKKQQVAMEDHQHCDIISTYFFIFFFIYCDNTHIRIITNIIL